MVRRPKGWDDCAGDWSEAGMPPDYTLGRTEAMWPAEVTVESKPVRVAFKKNARP